jgi:membrane protein implicated in regulation of membrane protease activity
MPGWAATLVVGAFTVLTNAIVTAYYYGRLSQRVDTNSDELKHQADDMRNQWGHIGDLRADVGKVKGKLGINGA